MKSDHSNIDDKTVSSSIQDITSGDCSDPDNKITSRSTQNIMADSRVIPVNDFNCSISDKESTSFSKSVRTYPQRFWILVLFSFLVWFQCLQWNLWGPLSESVEAAFDGWGSDTVAMMANWGTITFVIFTVPFVWLIDRKGLRVGVIVIIALTTIATTMRILPFINNSDSFFKVMCHMAAILNGIAGPLVMSAPPLVASVWFPPRERTTATACGQLFNQLGSAGSYLQPLIVRSPAEAGHDIIRSDIERLLFIYAGVSVVTFIAILVYFPAKPPTPPSISSGEERFDFKNSSLKLLKNPQFMLVFLNLNLSIGVPAVWLSVLNYSLKPLGIDQNEAMWVGFLAVASSVFAGLAISRITDLLYGHMRVTLLAMMIGDALLFFWFFVLTWDNVAVAKWQVYVSVIAGFSLNVSTMPLFTELAVETVYPCSELVVAGFLTFGMNIVGIVFLSLFLVPNIGYDWVTYVLVATSSLSLVPILFIKEDYKRMNVDQGTIRS